MKHLLIISLFILSLFSCKKETEVTALSASQMEQNFLKSIQTKLKDSLSATDYNEVDFSKIFKSKDAQSSYYFVRIGLLNKDISTDFMLLQTDSLGAVQGGRIIHVNKSTVISTNTKFNGQFLISSLNRQYSNKKMVTNGKLQTSFKSVDMMAAVDEQTLPEVVVTSYIDNGTSVDWYWYSGLYSSGGGYSTGGGDAYGTGYTYGAAGGGGSSTTVQDDNTIVLEAEANDDPAIAVSDYVKCFGTIPDANATFKITIFSDVPVNNSPSMMFNPATGSPGHSFIQLTKSDGGTTIQQNIGFYPATGWKSLYGYAVDSKIVDNAGHDYDASLSMNVNAGQFQVALTEMQSVSSRDYNIENWNCTDFALHVFNSASSTPLQIPRFIIPGDYSSSNTPQGLYTEIKSLQTSNNASHGTPVIPPYSGNAGESHGTCK